MKVLLTILGVLFFIAAIALGLYVGIGWALVGGIVTLAHAINGSGATTSAIVWAIVKIVLCETFGGLAALVPWGIGSLLIVIGQREA